MEAKKVNTNGSGSDRSGEFTKELAGLRARLAELTATLRNEYGSDSKESHLSEEISAAIQRLELRLANCPSAVLE